MKLGNTSIRRSKPAVFLAALAPAIWLGWRSLHNHLGANPIETITHFTGDWALRFLLITLLVTPLRRLLGMPELVRFRRMLGLFAFFYGSLHFLTYLVLDKFFDLNDIGQDIAKRKFITVGLAGLLLMIPLAVTSTAGWIRRLGGGRWQLLHRLVYFSAIAGIVHYYWLVKSDIRLPVFYGLILAALLLYRLFVSRANRPADVNRMKLVRIEPQTPDTVTLRFQLVGNRPLRPKPGQFLTFDWVLGGKKLPRSYSISSSPRQTHVEVTVKKQGVVSSFLTEKAKVGLQVDARGPYGQFYFDENRDRRIVLFAGGSGITPIMSMLRHIDEIGAETEITLFYSVRTEHDIIFEQELERLRQRLPKFSCVVIASKPGAEWQGLRGRVNRELVAAHLETPGDRTFFLCGPAGFMADVKDILLSLGVGSDQIRQESFSLGSAAGKSVVFAPPATCTVEFARSGRKLKSSAGLTVLAIADNNGIDIPYSCRTGQCGTCATRVLDGDLDMDVEDGLDPTLKAQGYRLLCVGRVTDHVRLDA